jgi:hypothetical protein
VVCVFARKTSEPLASLVKQIDKKIADNSQLKSFVVICGTEPDKMREALGKLALDNSIKHVPLTMFGETGGPANYELSRDADVTVLMWDHHKVKVNHAYKGELTDKEIGAIVDDIPKLLAR